MPRISNGDCASCGTKVDLHTGHYCMIQHHLWHTMPKEYQKEVLCLDCIELHLGRRLTPEDFPADIPINSLCVNDRKDPHLFLREEQYA